MSTGRFTMRMVVFLELLLLLCSPGLIASRSLSQDVCAKCNIPVGQGGCKCDANCACIGGGGGGKCGKCNLPENAGGCKCDANCDCLGGSGGSGKCGKCNLPENAGGCKCDANCDCVGAPTPPVEVPTAPVNRVTCQGGSGCNDKDVRCVRSVNSIDVSTGSTTGCSLGAGASKVGVTIDGKCYQEIRKEEKGSFVVMGYVCMGQCFDLFKGGCQIANCGKGTPAARCDEYVPQCKGLCEGQVL